jgi:hypothetical protein
MQKARFSLWHLFAIISMIAVAFACFRIDHPTFWISFPMLSLAARLNAQVKVSHVIRALVGLMLHAEASIDRRAGENGPLVRPANGDAQGLQQFERDIGQIFATALRDAGPLR